MKTIDYYLSLISPWSFMGGVRLADIAAKHQASVRIHPMNLGQVFPVTGGLPLPKRSPQRQDYRLLELDRWRKFLGIPLNLRPAHFPSDESGAAHLLLACIDHGGDGLALATAFGQAVWLEERDIADPATQRDILLAQGLDADALSTAVTQTDYAERRAAISQQAIDTGVFGAPSYLYDGELFWGQDRLDFLDRALAER